MPTLPGPTVITGGTGGGFAIGSSYLRGDGVTQAALVSGVLTFHTWTLLDSAGADIAIDGMDNTKIDIATAGWYSVYYDVETFPENLGVLADSFTYLLLNGQSINQLAGADVGLDGTSGTYRQMQNAWTALELAALDVLQAKTVASVGADTWAMRTANLTVLRLA